jgi:hypothetical protein
VDRKTAKKIGQRLAIISGLIGLTIAYILFRWVSYRWDSNLTESIFGIAYVELRYHLMTGAIGLLTMAYFCGQLAGVDILIKHKNDLLTGIKYGLLTLVTGTLIGSSVGFIKEGINNFDDLTGLFYVYYLTPLYWMTFFGIVPAIIVGLWFGRQTKRQGLKFKVQ